MTSPESALHVEVVGDEIVVSLPESQYSVTYYKASPQLRAKHITKKYDPHVPMTVSEFVARAWKLANDKARELRWRAVAFRPRGGASHALRPTRASASEVTRTRPASSTLVPAS